MKNLQIALLIIIYSYSAKCQMIFTTSKLDSITLLNKHYQLLHSAFLHENPKPGCIIFLGNSLTENADWNSLLRNNAILNRGISGDITSGVLNRLDEVIRHLPSKLFIEIGTNDINNNIPSEITISYYEKIITKIKKESPKTSVYIQSLLPVNTRLKKLNLSAKYNEQVIHLNSELSNLSIEYNVHFINLHPLMLDQNKELKKEYTSDGLHLNKIGYKVWTDHLKPCL